MVILPIFALTYGAECWALKMEDERRLKTTEMRMLRMMCGKTLKDKMNNEKILEITGVVRLEEFLREKRLQWLGHVERMDEKRGLVKAVAPFCCFSYLFIYLLCVSFKPSFIIFVNLHLEATTRSSRQVFNPLNRCKC